MPTLRTEPRHVVAPEAADEAERAALRAQGLRCRVAVGPSPIDGQGAFAAEPLAAGRKIGEIRGVRIPAREAQRRAAADARLYLIALDERTCLDASASADVLRHTNHACAPNAHYRLEQGRVAVYALRAIAPGEEITLDYGTTHHAGRLACRCGAARCRRWL
jgi:SET domain-containing protein